MFGGAAVPANSTHLRKSGSRPVVYDLGNFNYKSLNSSCCYF